MKVNLNNVRFKLFKELFPIIEKTLTSHNVDFYIQGALARDMIFSTGQTASRTTSDVDLALYISGGPEKYDAIIKHLTEKYGFTQNQGNTFCVVTPEGHTIDLLPFGDIEVEDGISISGQALVDSKENGFKEVYDAGLITIESEEGQQFSIASLEAIVLLKLIAFDDRPEYRLKDPADVASIINHYFDLNQNIIYEEHNDLFEEFDGEEYTLQAVSAQVIGRRLRSIVLLKDKVEDRIISILEAHIEKKEYSSFIRGMVGEDCKDIDTAVFWLKKLVSGIKEENG